MTATLTKAAVRAATLAKLEGSLLDEDSAELMGIEAYTAEECRKALKLPAAAAGFKIPYFTLDGTPTAFYRYRYMEDTRRGFDAMTGKKPLRYAQPASSETEVYLPPLWSEGWEGIAARVEVDLFITEGELKAACAVRHGIACIGLGGVWSFMSKKHGHRLLPVFKQFTLEERRVLIVFDSDAVTNPDVVAAELRLAQELTHLGAHVFIVRLPPDEQVKKVGLDDYLVLNGVDSFKQLVDEFSFEYRGSKVLHELNQRVLYVRNPGFIWDHQLEQKLQPAAFKEHAFSNLQYEEVRVTAKGNETVVRVPAAPAWLQWPHRAEASGVTFAPGEPRITEAGLLNTWGGWGVSAPRAGDVTPWLRLMEHLFGDDEEGRRCRVYFERWCAYPLQHPGYKMAVAAAIWGPVHGSGKTLVGHTLMRLYGKHAAELKDVDLDDERAEWAVDKQFVLADDITARGDRKFMRRLMTMITQKFMRLNPKYVPSHVVPDLINYYFTSNDPDALFMDDADRRFFVWETRGGRYLPYREYVRWRDSEEGIAALWHYFLELDLGDFDPQEPAPETTGKLSMIHLGKSDLGAWVLELKQNGAALLARAKLKGDLFNARELHALFDPTGQKKASPNALARELKRAGFHPPANGASLRMPDGTTVMAYAVLNGDKWAKASWKLACDHYIGNRPASTWAPLKKGKY